MLEAFSGRDIQSALGIITLLADGEVVDSSYLFHQLNKEIKFRAMQAKSRDDQIMVISEKYVDKLCECGHLGWRIAPFDDLIIATCPKCRFSEIAYEVS